jgi:mRNA-degrading endonuclease RelE of RelBE toxin-antitoxin system
MSESSIRIEYTDRFKKDVKRLYKKYRHVQSDINTFIAQLERGEFVGDQIQGIGYPVYKERIKSSDLGKGKSGGYRVIYYLRTETHVVLITTYAKSEREEISADELRRIIQDYARSME